MLGLLGRANRKVVIDVSARDVSAPVRNPARLRCWQADALVWASVFAGEQPASSALQVLLKGGRPGWLALTNPAGQDDAVTLVDAVEEFLAGHADPAAFPVAQLSGVNKAPSPVIALRWYWCADQGRRVPQRWSAVHPHTLAIENHLQKVPVVVD